jgi:hypothetical protein
MVVFDNNFFWLYANEILAIFEIINKPLYKVQILTWNNTVELLNSNIVKVMNDFEVEVKA